ncbi:MAG: helix-turn-helix transcriptional regulator [Rhodospirillaceae bacterium]|nr:helix-turn-helix transcriptional regulator [Rhodospirillaceae bacterium]
MNKSDRVFARTQLRDLGRQIRLLRERRSLSLNDLARQCGVSVTGIRNIELGRANPGLLTMVAIIDALGVPIDELINMTRRASKTVHVSRAPDPRQRVASVQRSLSELYEPHFRGRMVTLPAGTDLLAARKSEAGPQFAFVLEGDVQMTMKDGSACELAAGDAIHIADQPPRIVANNGRRAARLLWVKDNHGEFARGDSNNDRGR